MGYQKIMNLSDNTPNQPSKFRTKNSVEINNGSHRTYSTGSQTKFKTSMRKLSLSGYSNAYILAKRNVTVAAVPAGGGNNDK